MFHWKRNKFFLFPSSSSSFFINLIYSRKKPSHFTWSCICWIKNEGKRFVLSNEDAKEKWLKRNAFERARLCRALAIAHTKYTTIQCLTMTSIQKNFNSFPMGPSTHTHASQVTKREKHFALSLSNFWKMIFLLQVRNTGTVAHAHNLLHWYHSHS